MKKIKQPTINDLENMLDIAETTQSRQKLSEFKIFLEILNNRGYDTMGYQIRGNEVDKNIPTLEGYYK